MSPEQKSSIYVLAVCGLTAAAYLALAPFVGPAPATGALGLLGLLGFQRLFYRKRPGTGKSVVMDERDIGIARRAGLFGGMCSYLVMIALCMGLWTIHQAQGKALITVHALPLIVAGAGVALWVARSIAVLFLYRKDAAHE